MANAGAVLTAANATKTSAIEAKSFFMSHLLRRYHPKLGPSGRSYSLRHCQHFAGDCGLLRRALHDYASDLWHMSRFRDRLGDRLAVRRGTRLNLANLRRFQLSYLKRV